MTNEWQKVKGWSAVTAIIGVVFLLVGGPAAFGTLGVWMLLGGLFLFIVARFKTS